MSEKELPLFPLNTVLFPGGPVSLRIFETRYLDMVSRCLRNDEGFGVVLIQDGQETGEAQMHSIGTEAWIRDWNRLEDGLLGIVGIGEERFEILSMERQPDGLYIGRVRTRPGPPEKAVPGEYQHLAQIVRQLMPQLPSPWRLVEHKDNDAAWVGYRLAEVLPLNLAHKQQLLELEDPEVLLGEIEPFIRLRQPEDEERLD